LLPVTVPLSSTNSDSIYPLLAIAAHVGIVFAQNARLSAGQYAKVAWKRAAGQGSEERPNVSY
jgi:hypothetical protein